MKAIAAALLMTLAMALPAAALPATGVALTGAQERQIESGEVVVEVLDTGHATMRDVVSIGYVDAPPAAVWKVITDYGHYDRIFPNIKRAETRAKHGATEDHYVEFDYPWPLPDKWVLNRITHDPAHYHITWHRVDGSVKEVVGSWKLLPVGKRTLVIYTVRVDPGLPLVPQWAITWGTQHVAPQIITRLRERAK